MSEVLNKYGIKNHIFKGDGFEIFQVSGTKLSKNITMQYDTLHGLFIWTGGNSIITPKDMKELTKGIEKANEIFAELS
jgi:hypothetical protein